MTLPIKTLRVKNLLSYGETADAIELRPLNVLIGPNGSGKSNLIETINLLTELPRDMSGHIARNSGILHWLWKGADRPTAEVEVNGSLGARLPDYEHSILFTRVEQSMQVIDESVSVQRNSAGRRGKPLFSYENGLPTLRIASRKRLLEAESIDHRQSILWRDQPPEVSGSLAQLSRLYRSFRFFRGRQLNHIDPAKLPQLPDQPGDFLSPDARNLGAVLNRLLSKSDFERSFMDALSNVYEGIEAIDFLYQAGTLQIYLRERSLTESIPASRFSDGTFRWLCLLAVLLDPEPPALICLEEPEIGLHPDIVVELAGLLRRASERTQLIVTTHSDTLVDALSDTPESVIVCEKLAGSTVLRRLDEGDLTGWLKKYGLGQLWRRGEVGGNRW